MLSHDPDFDDGYAADADSDEPAFPAADKRLVVTLHGRTERLPLPAFGAISIGRSPSNDVCIADTLVSRRHAVLHLGRAIEVEDLGSQNGITLVVPPDELQPGETASERTVPLSCRLRVPPGAILYVGNASLSIENAANVCDGHGVVASDPQMQRLFALVERVAPSEISVLLLGESGVGKEVFAERIHGSSPRRGKPFMSINCGALTATLLESELFGHEKGAFTGATRSKPGLLEAADGGVVFLDEIGELPAELQVKLLRVLEERKLLRLGSVVPRAIDVRFVAATNRDLRRAVDAGWFRRDLYYRLNGISLHIPPLRKRASEIGELAELFLRQFSAGAPPELSQRALDALLRYGWPGNIRELRNVIERAVILSRGGCIEPVHLGLEIAESPRLRSVPPPAPGSPDCPHSLRKRADVAERDRIARALEACSGNQTRAAKMLGMTRRALIGRLEKYGLPRPRKRKQPRRATSRAS